MSTVTKTSPTAFIILNPVAGVVNAQILHRLIESRFHAAGWKTRIHLTVPEESLTTLIKKEIAKGVDLVVAVGGDGTIAAVTAGLVHTNVPLGIIPTGTWNAIARNLRISFNPIRAISTMTGPHRIRKLDLMEVGEDLHAMNLGVGFSSSVISNTSRDAKRRIGNFAYFSHMIKQVFGFELRKYLIEADGKIYRGRATEIMVANYGVVGLNLLESSLNIHPDDGKVDVLILTARTVLDLPGLFWQAFIQRKRRTPKYRQISAVKRLTIQTSPAMVVQSDGELIGKTPVTITVLPRAVKVIVPA
jgi:diacylglycerol kinase (ATP)